MQKPPHSLSSKFRLDILKAHQFQGALNDCGPFSTAIILNALLGLDVQGSTLAAKMNQLQWRGILPVVRRIPGWATFPWGVTDVLREYGLKARWKLFEKTTDLFNNLFQGKVQIVVIGEWRPLWAHYLVLVEYTSKAGFGFADPASPSAAVVWKDPDKFHRLWKNYGQMVITVTPPSSNLKQV
ncbi:MAG: hypothetical protein IT308_13120 [Anaerolineaceae bacterium]|nr:hypothetical protein [Anaerolineaceae bacterium]